MDGGRKLAELLSLAEALGVEVRAIPATDEAPSGRSAGAFVCLKGRDVLFVDPTAPVANQIALVVEALQGREEIEERFVKPAIRDLLTGPSASVDRTASVARRASVGSKQTLSA